MTDRATDYARRVITGEVVAGKPHIQACQRHLRDLERQGAADFPYLWRPERSEEILNFAETLTIAEGSAPTPVRLYGFQCFDLGVTFGWYNARGFRRFRRSYKSVARQNGKTFENGIKGSYIAGFGGYQFGKLFTVATKHAQAKLAWDEIKKFIAVDPDLAEYFKIQEYKTLITALATNCTIEALSKDRSLDDGMRSIYSSVDEIHQHRDNSFYKAIYNGTRALDETLVSMITTRGKDLNGFCYEMDTYCMHILDGSATAEDFFVDIYTLDEGDNWRDERNWIKANPLLAATEQGMTALRTDAQTAADMGGMDLRDFLTKALNMWSQIAANPFIDVDRWNACGTTRTLDAFRGVCCFVGIDFSSGGDLCTIALEIPFTDGTRQKVYLYSHSYMPRARLAEHIRTDLAPYDIWERDRLITVTGGESDYKNDYKFIIRELHALQEDYELQFTGIGYDPHNADGILADLEEFGCPLMEITQSARFLNAATEDLRLSVKEQTVEYERANALLSWSFVNARLVKNSFGEIKVDKQPNARHRRIDPVDACINAHVLTLRAAEPQVNPEEELQKYLALMGWGSKEEPGCSNG